MLLQERAVPTPGIVRRPAKIATCLSSVAHNANVARALPTTARIVLDVELDPLSFLERVELAGSQGRVVEEDLAAVVGAYEAEAPISDQANDGT
jgi:hypothetical protein